ncbi:hypothetical protein [Halalkalicoccus ordinarius]|uniref:hypothetical protein n=1 Tax=Halalkalicoccus ordinarius TaxID=3116651 RepID=UPI00300EEB92
MIDRLGSRLLGLAVLLCVLFGLLVGAGTLAPDPSMNRYPDHGALDGNYDAYEGDRVEVSGTVVAVDPVVVEHRDDIDGALTLTIENVDEPVEPGQELRVFGTARPGGTIDAEETVVVSRWETYYAWIVSFVAGLWVLGRFLRDWRFDPSTSSFEPREVRDA